ncbi:Serine/threonine-protein kinase WNK1 [Glycine max]|nr:Serine/threonine-protein kinase WNK1 [Glycine max]
MSHQDSNSKCRHSKFDREPRIKDLERLKSEIHLLKTLKHKNIMKFDREHNYYRKNAKKMLWKHQIHSQAPRATRNSFLW